MVKLKLRNSDSVNSLREISLHDVRIDFVEFDIARKSLVFCIPNIFANYVGFPEYPGLTSCTLKFLEVHNLFLDIEASAGIRITEMRILVVPPRFCLELDLNLGGGPLTQGASSITAAFGKLEIENVSDDSGSRGPTEDDKRLDRVWMPGDEFPA